MTKPWPAPGCNGDIPDGYWQNVHATVALVCERCGAIVGHVATHDRYHDSKETE